MVGSSHKARTPAVETTATSTNLPAFAAPEMDVPQKKIAGILTDSSTILWVNTDSPSIC